MELLKSFFESTGVSFLIQHPLNIVMIAVGLLLIFLAIRKGFEPLLLVPIGFGIIIGNLAPLGEGTAGGMVTNPDGTETFVKSTMYYLNQGIKLGIYPPLIFLGIGALTDFSAMLANPRLIILGGAAQLGIFTTFLGAQAIGFHPYEAAAIGIIGGADGPTSIFVASKLAPHLLGAIAIAAYSYMALVPVIQPPIIKFLTSKEERLIRMKKADNVSRRMLILFPMIGFITTAILAPGAFVLLGMLFFGNLLKESGVTDRLSNTAKSAVIDTVTIVLGLCVGCSTTAATFLTPASLKIFAMGAVAFSFSTAGGVIFAKTLNLFLKDKINPIIGAAGVSAVPNAAKVCQVVAQKEDPTNFVIMHAMAPNVAGVIGSAVAAGIFLSMPSMLG